MAVKVDSIQVCTHHGLHCVLKIDTFAHWVIVGSRYADNDHGDMFLNFPLHTDLQRLCGIDLTELFPEFNPNYSQMLVAAWVCNAMGLLPLPCCSI